MGALVLVTLFVIRIGCFPRAVPRTVFEFPGKVRYLDRLLRAESVRPAPTGGAVSPGPRLGG